MNLVTVGMKNADTAREQYLKASSLSIGLGFQKL